MESTYELTSNGFLFVWSQEGCCRVYCSVYCKDDLDSRVVWSGFFERTGSVEHTAHVYGEEVLEKAREAMR